MIGDNWLIFSATPQLVSVARENFAVDESPHMQSIVVFFSQSDFIPEGTEILERSASA